METGPAVCLKQDNIFIEHLLYMRQRIAQHVRTLAPASGRFGFESSSDSSSISLGMALKLSDLLLLYLQNRDNDTHPHQGRLGGSVD